MTIGVHPTTAGLHLLVDSTGIKMLGEGQWKTKKHGAEHRRQWRKVDLGIDATTLEIRAIEVTDNAYDTKACHKAIARRGAQAIIPTRKNAKPWKDRCPGAEARNAILCTTRRLGRKILKKRTGYHRRSLVETKMRCFKLLGERVMARDFDRHVAELQVRVAILNRLTQLGTPTTVAMP